MNKTIMTITLLVLSAQVLAANVTCAKVGRYLRPVSKDAVKLATYLNVGTCNGKLFKTVLKNKKVKMSIVAASPEMILKYKSLATERNDKKTSGFSF